MDTLEIFQTIPSQYNYYFDVKIPDVSELRGVNKILICAMGGSAFPVEIAADHIKEKYGRDILFVSRDYKLPYWVKTDTLVIACSFSGSTEETLSCMKEAIDRGLPVMGMSMGGEISRICSEQKIPYISLPKVVMPRFGSGYIVGSVFRLMTELRLIPAQNEEIQNVEVLLNPLIVNIQKTAQEYATDLKDRFLTIYSDQSQQTAIDLSRIALNETGKVLAYGNIYSESNHNEMASFKYSPYKHGMLLLTYPGMHPRMLQRFEIVPELVPHADILLKKVNCNFENILYRDIYYQIFFCFLSYYLAVNAGHDPVEIDMQEDLKKRLKQIK